MCHPRPLNARPSLCLTCLTSGRPYLSPYLTSACSSLPLSYTCLHLLRLTCLTSGCPSHLSNLWVSVSVPYLTSECPPPLCLTCLISGCPSPSPYLTSKCSPLLHLTCLTSGCPSPYRKDDGSVCRPDMEVNLLPPLSDDDSIMFRDFFTYLSSPHPRTCRQLVRFGGVGVRKGPLTNVVHTCSIR